ncbi:3-carboxy-cis,cis-muconate cycloisomerase [Asanoa ishikariensis]|uniref:3-carboxy-cis,cis-muconate cycloisomerase n=1 Tax=Asanoa ishikariensis TaxID=137265 RepID=A0A1H3R6E9_9ACTN|nr:lyase family protein [Asanoa ishikariensis]GIF64400.1 3-carboxy-cis,cis-muconate cycloisomerase [Asanoa ishikariensis]SDZ20851.1 3-carboxy-cis,cis-muconate cycloisomerase [Asanoa ishikariensis]
MRPSSSPSEGLFAGILERGAVPAAVADEAWVRAMLSVESALAAANAGAGVIPVAAGEAIVAACADLAPDPAALGAAAAAHATPVVPLVTAIRAAVPPEVREHVHAGATSQDVLDTAAMLVTRRALAALLSDLDAAADAAAVLAAAHRDTVLIGRTLLQQAVPTTFGLTAAGWLTGLDAAALDLRGFTPTAQLGGAAGTLAGLGPAGPAVLADFARRLDLAAPDLPWHTERGRIGRLAGSLGVAAGALGKPARDVTLLAQGEVGEVAEDAPGGSSAMAHKHNPVAAISTLAATAQAPGLVATLLASAVQEHQRGAGGWQAEWRPLRELLVTVGSAAAWLRTCLSGLVVHPDVMRANLDRAGWPTERGATDPVGSAGHFVDLALARHSSRRTDG